MVVIVVGGLEELIHDLAVVLGVVVAAAAAAATVVVVVAVAAAAAAAAAAAGDVDTHKLLDIDIQTHSPALPVTFKFTRTHSRALLQ